MTDEKEIILRARAGDGEAFARLYQKYFSRIYGVVARRTRDREEVEDLVQVAFLRAFEGLRTFRGESAFSTWLTRIAMNVCVSHYESRCVRNKWHEVFQTPGTMAWLAWDPTPFEDPETALYAKECRDIVQTRIRSLPGQYQRAMWLRYVEDYSYTEIETALQVPMGTVKTWLYRGRELLEESLETVQAR
ncbi:MAG: sigma-70 family RNA polymerase sigma factor [bacterium]|nr:sigma-70 family RNA polymerase sigma factor [bacterium]